MKGARRPGICQPSDKILDQICFRKSTGNTGKVLIPDSLWLELLANHKQRWQVHLELDRCVSRVVAVEEEIL